jgi:hypothetical protein
MLAHADPDVGEAMAGAAALRADARIPAEMIGAARIARMVRVRVLVMNSSCVVFGQWLA